MTRHEQKCSSLRRGLSRIDVLVILGIVVLCAAFFVPNLSSRRISTRKMHCLSNMRNVGLAMQNYASSNNGDLPSLTALQKIRNSADQEGEMIVAWPVVLLPALDNTALLRRIRQNAIVESGQARMGEDDRVAWEVMSCPDDQASFKKPGRMSFVPNAGFISRNLYSGDPDRNHQVGSLSWDGNDIAGEDSDVKIHAATGVVWHSSEAFQSSLEYVLTGDGASVTLLLTENLQAGNWYDVDTARIGFGYPVANTNSHVPFGWGATFESTEKPLNAEFSGDLLSTVKPNDWQINSDLNAKAGTRPRPSSNHKGGVNVIMCDGAGKFLNQNIDPHVYLKLLTANGITYGEGKLPMSSY